MIFIAFCAANSMAQKVTVIEKTNLLPIVNAAVYSHSPRYSTLTNQDGEADISLLKNADSIFFQCTGFQTVILSYNEVAEKGFKVAMTEKIYDLNTVVISARKFEEKIKDVPQQIQVINSKQIEFQNPETSADMLQQTGNILVQKSQMGGGSPIIRGFEANKLLIVVDGIRMNNAIYRGGHLQSVITVDPSILDKTEIVYGPGSVVYGSDALGGVMHFYTKNPELTKTDKENTDGSAFLRYSSANNEFTGHADFNTGWKKFGLLGSFTYSNFSDLREGSVRNPAYGDFGKRFFYADRINGQDTMMPNNNYNMQTPSGYSQYDILFKALFKQNEHATHNLNFQFSNSSDIPRYDRLTQMSDANTLKYAQWYYGPQQRLLAAYTLGLTAKHSFYDYANVILAYQNALESRNDRKFNKDILNHRNEEVSVMSANVDLTKAINKNELRYGLEYVYNTVNSTANTENINTGETGPLDTRYPDGGSNTQSFAAYFTHSIEFNPKYILTEGIRYSYNSLYSKFNDTTFYPFPYDDVSQKSGALSGNIGFVMMPGHNWRFSVLGATGYRAPNVDDMSKVFESVPGSVIVPNPDLKPEYTYNVDLSASKLIAKKLNLYATGYYTWYNNAIVTEPSSFNGQDSIYYDGSYSQVTSSTNAGQAYIYGANAGFSVDITQIFSLSSTLNYTYGRVKTDSTDYPLDHIPPVYGRTSFNVNITKFHGEFYVVYNGWKRLDDYSPSGEDNLDQATQYGMPAWYTLNLKLAYQINQHFQVNIGFENITDLNYRVFASGISAPGFNCVVALRGRL